MAKKTKDGNPWDRLPQETNKDYALFRTYLELGRYRTRQEVIEISGENYSRVYYASRHHEWEERAGAYDELCYSAVDEVTLTQMRRHRRKQLRHIIEMQDKAMRGIRSQKIPTNRDARAMLESSIKLHQLLVGQATERTEATQQSVDVSKLSEEQLWQYKEILKAAGADDADEDEQV